MADFSKEYCENHNFGRPGDFSIIEEFNQLDEGHWTQIICEGYGFVGITKEDELCKLVYKDFDNPESNLQTIEFEKIKNLQYEEIKKLVFGGVNE